MAPRPIDLAAMVNQDVEAVKNFLIERNNASELNIEKLCLVGAEMGSVVAINFAARDWSWPVLATGKQGQDVKGLVLISPEWAHRGLHINDAIEQPQVRGVMSLIIIAGERAAKERRDAERLYTALERFRPVPASGAPQTLWLRTLPTTLQSTHLLNEKRMGVGDMIEKFIELRLVDVDIPWRERRNPLQ
jgi:pimeloyl-ACP methyl ester carboxylesterase